MGLRRFFIFLFGITSSFATTFNLYSADGRFAGQVEAETDGEIAGKLRKNIALYKKKVVKAKTFALKRNAVMEDSVSLNLDTLPEWIELEKNTAVVLCRGEEGPGNWAVSNATGRVLDGGCFLLETPNVTGVAQISFMDSVFRQEKTVRIAVGMKVLDLNGKKGKVGFHGEDYYYKSNRTVGPLDQESNRVYLYPERIVDLEGVWLVDKYPVTNCDFVLAMDDSISSKCHSKNKNVDEYFRTWVYRKRDVEKSGMCNVHDSAAIKIYLYNALVYANRRSEREGLSPVYSFKLLKEDNAFFPALHADGSFEIYTASFFKNYDNRNLLDGWIRVTVDTAANGYRLPYHDEWMVLARGGDMDGIAYWREDSLAKDYAWFGSGTPYRQDSRPVGMLLPNGYGLHDVLGLVCENVLLPGKSTYGNEISICKGGFLSDSLQQLNYGRKNLNSTQMGWGGYQGLRLLRRIR